MGSTRVGTWTVWLAALLVIFAAAAGAAQNVQVSQVVNIHPVTETVAASNGTIDWTNGVIEAVGEGVPSREADSAAQCRLTARRAAVVEAQRNLAETIYGVHLTSATTVRMAMVESDEVRSQMQAFLQGARVVSERQMPDGAYQVVMRMGMYGPASVSAAALAPVIAEEKSAESAGKAPRPVITLKQTVLRPELAPEPPMQVGPFTGLIVDCRGLGAMARSICPKIYDTTGKEVWGTVQIDADQAIESGIVTYYLSVDDAKKGTRAGSNPLLISAAGTGGRAKLFQCDAVVSVDDGKRILDENSRSKFLDKLRVSFVIDE